MTSRGGPLALLLYVEMICIILVAGHGFVLEKEIQVSCGAFRKADNMCSYVELDRRIGSSVRPA